MVAFLDQVQCGQVPMSCLSQRLQEKRPTFRSSQSLICFAIDLDERIPPFALQKHISFSSSLHPATEQHHLFKRPCSPACSVVYCFGVMPPLVCAISCDAPKTASKPNLSWYGQLTRYQSLSEVFLYCISIVLTAYPAEGLSSLPSARLYAQTYLQPHWWMMFMVHAIVMPFQSPASWLFCQPTVLLTSPTPYLTDSPPASGPGCRVHTVYIYSFVH